MLLASEDLLLITTRRWSKLMTDGEKLDFRSWLFPVISSLGKKVDLLRKFRSLSRLSSMLTSLFWRRFKSMGRKLILSSFFSEITVNFSIKKQEKQRLFLGTLLNSS